MKMKKSLFLLIILMIISVDQLSKMSMLDLLSPGSFIEVTSFFNLVLVFNPGVSFGLLSGVSSTILTWLLLGFTCIIVIVAGVWLIRTRNPYIATGLGLVIGGALGNGIDRYRIGAVVDFLDFHIQQWHWPAFNIADTALVTGTFILIYGMNIKDSYS